MHMFTMYTLKFGYCKGACIPITSIGIKYFFLPDQMVFVISPENCLYRKSVRYYDKPFCCRGSSTVEHSFRKAGVEGSIPFFGCECFGDFSYKITVGVI